MKQPDISETGEWIFYSKNLKTGKILRVDMEKLVKFIDAKFGTDFVKEFTIDEGGSRSAESSARDSAGKVMEF